MVFQRKQTGCLIALALVAQAPLSWAEETPAPVVAADTAPAAPIAPPVIETAPAPVVFQINEFEVDGNTLLAPEKIQALTQPFTGPGRDFAAVQGALEALQKEYQRIGHGAVQVILPEQELDQGIVKLQVVEQTIARITITGNEHFDNDNILRSMPHVREGEIPNTGAISRDLRLANENPAKRTSILFRTSEAGEEGLEATVKVADEKPWKVFLSADNTGTSSTGFGRVGLGFQHYNVGNLDHRFTAQVVTNMSWPQGDKLIDREVKIFGFGYTIPFHELGDSLDMFAGYSNVNAGNPAGGGGLPFNVTGVGRVFGVHYNHNFDKIDNYTHKLRGGIDYHAYRTSNTLDAALTPKLTTTPVILAYQGQWSRASDTLAFSVSTSWNVPMADYAKADDFAAYDAEDDYKHFNWSLDYYRQIFNDWQLHLGGNGQLTGDHLPPGEQLGLGGMTTVRGWYERDVAGDKGYRLTAELTTPDYGKVIGDKVGLRWTLFTDIGHINFNEGEISGQKQPFETEKNFQSVGAGLRFNYGSRFVGRLDYALVVDGDKSELSGGRREDGDLYMHASMAFIW